MECKSVCHETDRKMHWSAYQFIKSPESQCFSPRIVMCSITKKTPFTLCLATSKELRVKIQIDLLKYSYHNVNFNFDGGLCSITNFHDSSQLPKGD